MWPRRQQPTRLPVPGILQARTQEWVAISFFNAWKVKSESEVAQSCPTLRDPIDCSLPGSSTHGISQAGVLEWGAIAFSVHTLYFPLFLFFITLFSWTGKENGEVQEKAPDRTLIFGVIHQAILEPQSSPSDSEVEAALERTQRRSSQSRAGRAGNAQSTQLSLVFRNASQEQDFWAVFFFLQFCS